MLTGADIIGQIDFKPTPFQVNGKSLPIMRVEISCERIDPLAWLSQQRLFPKVYWESCREGESVAAIGSLYSLSQVPASLKGAGVRFYGGMDFLERQRADWDGIPQIQYTLPLIELIERENQTILALNASSQEDLDSSRNALVWASGHLGTFTQKPNARFDTPSFQTWERLVNASLERIKEKTLEKVVLARSAAFTFDEPINPFELLRMLVSTSNRFGFQFERDIAFIGTSPEDLFHRQGRQITTAAIAGTRPLGKKWRKELMSSIKERNECIVVKEQIESALAPLCTDLQIDGAPNILETAHVQHLTYRFSGSLAAGVTDLDVMHALFPTPAVGGLPPHAALEIIRKNEGFDRGWYAAPVGYISENATHLLVGIRSALVSNQSLRLFSGAGIVAGSNPKQEWKELEHKIRQFVRWR